MCMAVDQGGHEEELTLPACESSAEGQQKSPSIEKCGGITNNNNQIW